LQSDYFKQGNTVGNRSSDNTQDSHDEWLF